LGYDIWNPAEVCPEYDADFAMKKAGQKEKVDFAIMIGGVPRIYFEVKAADTPLDGHSGQLARYFNSTQTVSLAILTNGVEYRFFTDTGDVNVMDQTPFFTLALDAVDPGLEILARFHKAVLSPEAIRDYATELNYTAKMVQYLRGELDLRDREPSENLVRWILSGERMYEGRVTVNVVERFCPIVRSALQIVLRDIVRRSVAALDKEVTAPVKSEETPAVLVDVSEIARDANLTEVIAPIQDPQKAQIETTERELECFGVVKELFENSPVQKKCIFDSSVRKEVPVQLSYKDTTGYFGVYLNRPSWWALRIVIEARIPWIGFNISPEIGTQLLPKNFRRMDPSPWAEFRVSINSPEDIRGLDGLVTAALQKTIDDRRPNRDTSASVKGAVA
jgi:predicted type IV restriction endonuclease